MCRVHHDSIMHQYVLPTIDVCSKQDPSSTLRAMNQVTVAQPVLPHVSNAGWPGRSACWRCGLEPLYFLLTLVRPDSLCLWPAPHVSNPE
jgi:hypothetical protein